MEDLGIREDFWRNKRVLLTGHTGFKGSWLSLWLQHLQAQVVGLSLAPPTSLNLFELASVADEMVHLIGDIRNAELVDEVVKTYSPDIIIHMAAQSLVRPAYEDPLLTYQTNVMGTLHVLEAARQSDSVKAVVNVTSDKCYATHLGNYTFHEIDPLGGDDPYSSSKGAAEILTHSYYHSFFKFQHKGLASARAGNVIGGGDWALDRLIPDMMRSLISQATLEIRYPQAVRPWQHVLEPLCGYLLLAEKLYENPSKYSEGWNFGPDESDSKTVQWIVEQCTSYLGEEWQFKMAEVSPEWHEAACLRLNSEKARRHLQWQPHWNINAALLKTIEWYQFYQRKKDMKVVTLEQIKSYCMKTEYLQENVDAVL